MRWPGRCGKCSIATPERVTVANPISVLVVDDDAVSRALLRALVQAAGYEVTTADHGREAWDALQVADGDAPSA
jgi:PleD family two-component response regulator